MVTEGSESDEGAETSEDGTTTGFTPRGADVVGQLNDHAEEHEFIAEMGITVESFEDGVLTATVPHNEKYANPGMGGTLHGGIIASILDTVMGFTIMAEISQQESTTMGPTISLTINYAIAATEQCIVTGEIIRLGSSTALVEGRIRGCESGEVVATADGVWRVYASE